MTKVLLVEDDNNLREIYEARLAAEGYDIATAKDGEDALAVAKQQTPDLIISDVMMPRISGFEMLDILRNTDGLKHTKVIMLTALGQAEDKSRANNLGADRYLVKSQVTLEDIVRAAEELLNPDSITDAESPAPQPQPAAAIPVVVDTPAIEEPVAIAPQPVVTEDPVVVAPVVPETPVMQVAEEPAPTIEEAATEAAPVIQMPQAPVDPEVAAITESVQSTLQETADVEQQIKDFGAVQPEAQTAPITEEVTAPTQVTEPAPTLSEEPSPEEELASAVNTLISPDTGPQIQPVSQPTPLTQPGIGQIPGKKVIQPPEAAASRPDISALLAQEEYLEQSAAGLTGQPGVDTESNQPPAPQANPDVQTPAPGGVFMPNSNGSADDTAL